MKNRKFIKAKNNIIDKAISYVAPSWALKRLAARTRLELAMQFRGAESSRLMANWILPTERTTPTSYELKTLRRRSRDLNRNDPVASGATDTLTINIVGRGLQPQSRLRAERLGIGEKRAIALQRQAEAIWQEWVQTADSGNRLDFDEIQFLALRKIIEDGEVIALPIMAKEPWRRIKRAIELLEADRLASPYKKKGQVHGDTGIELGARGEPKAYWLRKANYKNSLVGNYNSEFMRVEARDSHGRPKILHVFQAKRAGQLRGIPLFAPVITYFKDLADYMEAELVAARVAACLAVFFTREDPYMAAQLGATSTEDQTGERIQSIEPGLVAYLNPGESVNVVDPKRPGDSFGPFVENILRMIGLALNLPYELLVKDFSKTNYSSARAALLEGRRMFTTWRSWFARKFCQPIWDLVLEEAYLRGYFDAPNFYERRTEYTRAIWIGGGWGWVDPVKEVVASRKAIDYGLSTLAEEAAAQGRDWEEILEQRKRENQKVAELGVDLMRSQKGGATDAQTKEK